MSNKRKLDQHGRRNPQRRPGHGKHREPGTTIAGLMARPGQAGAMILAGALGSAAMMVMQPGVASVAGGTPAGAGVTSATLTAATPFDNPPPTPARPALPSKPGGTVSVVNTPNGPALQFDQGDGSQPIVYPPNTAVSAKNPSFMFTIGTDQNGNPMPVMVRDPNAPIIPPGQQLPPFQETQPPPPEPESPPPTNPAVPPTGNPDTLFATGTDGSTAGTSNGSGQTVVAANTPVTRELGSLNQDQQTVQDPMSTQGQDLTPQQQIDQAFSAFPPSATQGQDLTPQQQIDQAFSAFPPSATQGQDLTPQQQIDQAFSAFPPSATQGQDLTPQQQIDQAFSAFPPSATQGQQESGSTAPAMVSPTDPTQATTPGADPQGTSQQGTSQQGTSQLATSGGAASAGQGTSTAAGNSSTIGNTSAGPTSTTGFTSGGFTSTPGSGTTSGTFSS
jgi:hypothetical protein